MPRDFRPNIILDPKAHNLSSSEKEKVLKFNLNRVYNEPMVQSEFEDLLRDVGFQSTGLYVENN